jgi:hypothetical protein
MVFGAERTTPTSGCTSDISAKPDRSGRENLQGEIDLIPTRPGGLEWLGQAGLLLGWPKPEPERDEFVVHHTAG